MQSLFGSSTSGGSLFSNGPSNEEVDEGFRLLYPCRGELEDHCFGSLQAKRGSIQPSISTTTCTDDTSDSLGYVGYFVPNQTPPNYKLSNDLATNLNFIYGTVGNEYFDPDYDPNINILADYKNKKFHITENFLVRLEDFQRTKENVEKIITKLIDENYSRMIEYFTDLNVVETNLLATTHAIESVRRKLACNIRSAESRTTMIFCSEKRERLVLLQGTCKGLKLLKDLFNSLEKNNTKNETAVATEHLYHCLHTIQSESNAYYSKFICLKATINKLHDIINNTLDFCTHQLKIINCRKFEMIEFRNLIQCFLILDLISKDIKIERDGLKDEIVMNVSNFVDSLLQTQQKDISKALHFCAAIFAGNNAECDDPISTNSLYGTTKVSDLYGKIPAEKAHLCVVRTVMNFVDILLTHNRFINWFESPLSDTRADTKVEEEDVIVVEKSAGIATEHQNSKGVNQQHSSIRTRILCNSNPRFSIFRGEISLGRKVVWGSIADSVIEMLNGLKLNSKLKVNDYFTILWTINALLVLGGDFCKNSIASQQLLNAVVERSFAYFSDIYAHSKVEFKAALVADHWDLCPAEYESEIQAILIKGINSNCCRNVEQKLLFKDHIIEKFYSFPV